MPIDRGDEFRSAYLWANAYSKASSGDFHFVGRGNRLYVKSLTEVGVEYEITQEPEEGYKCTCKGFHYNGVCKHVAAIHLAWQRKLGKH